MPWAHADTVRSNVTSPAFRLHVVTSLSTDSGAANCDPAASDLKIRRNVEPYRRSRIPRRQISPSDHDVLPLPGFADKAVMRARQLGVMRRSGLT
jgi:hypothetical protein